MKPEPDAWMALRRHAAEQLAPDFAARVLRKAKVPSSEAWAALRSQGAAQIRPGFAARVLQAARKLPGTPSLADQFVLSMGTAAVCVLLFLLFQAGMARLEDDRNLETWQQIADQAQDDDSVI
jgi:hypothetical protein